MLPELPQISIRIPGLKDSLIVRAMSVRAFIAMEDSRSNGDSQIQTMAIIAKHCVPSWSEYSVDEILDSVEISVLTNIVNTAQSLTDVNEGKLESDQPVSLSSA